MCYDLVVSPMYLFISYLYNLIKNKNKNLYSFFVSTVCLLLLSLCGQKCCSYDPPTVHVAHSQKQFANTLQPCVLYTGKEHTGCTQTCKAQYCRNGISWGAEVQCILYEHTKSNTIDYVVRKKEIKVHSGRKQIIPHPNIQK